MTDKKNYSGATDAGLAAVLQFYEQAGVDCSLNDTPIDRFFEEPGPAATQGRLDKPAPRSIPTEPAAAQNPAAKSTSTQASTVPASTPRVPDEQAVTNALEAALSATSIDALRAALESFNDCNLRFGARSTVFADGNPDADVMFIGEAPGRDEDRQGLPFVGRAGQLLDKMLQAIGLDRTSCYITNIIPWRPPGNRTPTPLEIELCRPFIERHVALAGPKIVVLMGNVSTKSLLGTNRGILSFRGTWSRYHPNSDIDIPALPTLHPAYLLRNPAHKRLSWQDFLSVRAKLDTLSDKAVEA